jgi:hypothetical protein
MMRQPFTLYHFTDPANLPSIRERGLVPAPIYDGRKHPEAVWLTRQPTNPLEPHCSAMLTVTLDLFDRRLCSDPDPELDDLDPAIWGAHPSYRLGWHIYRGTISPDKIKFPA